MVKRGLGKGFDALIPTDLSEFDVVNVNSADERSSDLREVSVTQISRNPSQPRRYFDESELESLADSIREHGILQPLVLAPLADDRYEIVAGERRWRAAKIAKLAKVPAIVRTLSDQHKAELSIIENVQRSDLNPLEIANSLVKLREDFSLSNNEIAQRVGKNPATVSNLMRLVELPEISRKALADGKITEGHARQILALSDERAQSKLLDEILKNNWSVRKAEQFVLGYKNEKKSSSNNAAKISRNPATTADHTELTDAISRKLGLPETQITQRITAHGGQFVIKFSGEAEMLKIRKFFADK